MSVTDPAPHDTTPPEISREPGEFPDAAGEAPREAPRQETRLDAHAARLLTLAALLATLSTTTITLARHAPWFWVLTPLAASAALWVGAATVLLLGVIRPRPTTATVLNPSHTPELRAITPTGYRPHHAGELEATVAARYHALRLATDLLLAGFASLTVTTLALLARVLLP